MKQSHSIDFHQVRKSHFIKVIQRLEKRAKNILSEFMSSNKWYYFFKTERCKNSYDTIFAYVEDNHYYVRRYLLESN